MENQNPSVQALANTLIPEETRKRKFFSVMFFYSRIDLGIPEEACPDYFINRGSKRFDNYHTALDVYSNTRCPASQLIEADSLEELERKEAEMSENFKNKDWLDENVFPYL